MDRRIAIAAGHGGADAGAVARGRTEAAECIDIVNRTVAKLRADGRIETLVVPHAFNLRAQIAWVNQRLQGHESGYAVEVHKNSAGSGATGVEAWYTTGNAEAGNKAETVLGELARVSRLRNRGIKKDIDYRGGRLAWVRQTTPWAGLFECGFITHDHFNNDLYAEGLFRGLLKLFALEDKAVQIYRVIRDGGVQIGAFRVRANAWRAFLSIGGHGVILNREGRDVTAELTDEFAGRLVGEGLTSDVAFAPEESWVGDDEELVALEHDSAYDEALPPLEPADEEDEAYESGLESDAPAGQPG